MDQGFSVKIQQQDRIQAMEEESRAIPQIHDNAGQKISAHSENFLPIKLEDMQHHQQQEITREMYFLLFFSPKDTAQSIQRKNESMEMINFEKSAEEPDEIYNRRKKKVGELLCKQEQLLSSIRMIRQQDYGHYLAIIDFVTFFCGLKEKLEGIRMDYYSNKTFLALKNSNQRELHEVLRVLKKMYENISFSPGSSQSPVLSQSSIERYSTQDQKVIEFLIIPRFLISREKLNRLIKDQELQKNFEFLVIHECLGHYNNEANKKLPEDKQMEFVREILAKNNGRERFRKICSINHGNKFSIKYPLDYYQLYSKSLDYLIFLDTNFKKGKKYQSIKKQLEKHPFPTTEDTKGNSGKECFSESESSSAGNIYSFKNMERVLNKMANNEDKFADEELRDELELKAFSPVKGSNMRRCQIKKLMSFPNFEIKEEPIRSFKVKKSVTEKVNQTLNIILIQPPKNHEI